VAFNDHLDPEQLELVSNPEAVQKISQSLAAIMIERKLSLIKFSTPNWRHRFCRRQTSFHSS
jgi:hypothetical protein